MTGRRISRRVRHPAGALDIEGTAGVLVDEMLVHPETSPALSGGDVDADWTQAHLSGEEAVGGSVATPDQDIVDEFARALGVEETAEAEVRSLEEVVRDRDRRRWALEEAAAAEEVES